MLFDPARHEPLLEARWSEAAARQAISAIVADACRSFDAETLWPTHPADIERDEPALPARSGHCSGLLRRAPPIASAST